MKKTNKVLSLVLAVLLCVEMLPMSNITVFATTPHSHCVCGGNTNIGDHTSHTSDQEWQPTDTLPTTAGYYYLTSDITLTEEWMPADGTYLCLNGKVIRQTAEGQSVIVVERNKTFNLSDCGTNEKRFSIDDGVWQLNTNGENLLTGGVVTGANGASGIFAIGDIYIYNCNIVGNKSKSGGGLQCRNTGKFYNVNIIGNFTQKYGGGISSSYGNTEIYGGKIAHNTAQLTGGGVDSQFGNLCIQGTEISQNTASANGGGVWTSANTTVNISGDTIIKGNIGNNKTNNLYLAGYGTSSAKIAVGTMGNNASIGISADDNQTEKISTGGKNYANNFFSDNGAYAVAVDSENLKFVEKTVQVGKVTLGNGEYTTDGESTTTTKPESGGYAHFENGVLTLNNFTYSDSGLRNTIVYSDYDLTVKLVGTNAITNTSADIQSAARRCVWVRGDITIKGAGISDSLTVTTADQPTVDLSSVPICTTDGNLVIEDCTVVSSAGDAGDGNIYGLQGEDTIIENAVVKVNSGTSQRLNSAGLSVYDLTITNSTITACSEGGLLNSSGISAYGIMTVTDSTINAQSGNASTYDSYGISVGGNEAKLVWNSGTMLASCGVGAGDSDALYIKTNQISFGQDYWWRTSASDEYTVGQYSGNNEDGSYLEITTTEQHNYTYALSGQNTTVTETCTLCDHTATATIVQDYNGTAIYNGSAYGAKVVYSEKWKGDKVTELKYYKEQRINENLVSECVDAGDYFAVLTVEGVTAEWLFTISQKESVISIKPTVSNIVVNSTLSDISLNGGTVLGVGDVELEGEFSWKEPTAVMNTVGTQIIKVVFTPEDENYSVKIFDLEVSVVVCDAVDPNYKPTSPQTGDKTNIWLWVALMFMSVLSLFGIVITKKRKEKAK